MRIQNVRFAAFAPVCPPVLRRVARHMVICPVLGGYFETDIWDKFSGQIRKFRTFRTKADIFSGQIRHFRIYQDNKIRINPDISPYSRAN